MFLGLLRTVVYIVGVWFIWRWLDRAFGGSRGGLVAQHLRLRRPKGPRRADYSKEGEYVDFEEVKSDFLGTRNESRRGRALTCRS